MNKIKIPVVLIVHVLFIVLVYILQTAFFTYLPIGGVIPVLLPIAVVGIAVFEGSSRGGGYGLLAGMLCDISFNQPLSVMTVTLTLLGIFVGILSETIMARGFPTFFLSCFGALLLTSFVSMFSLLFFAQADMGALLEMGIRQTLISMLFTFPLYFAVRALGRRIVTAETGHDIR
jgi:rod shape-determining protein MreD